MMKNLIADIHLDRLRRNAEIVLENVPVSTKIIAVLKADGYGHGGGPAARVLSEQGISRFAVSDLDEALALRAEGVEQDILVLADTDPHRFEEAIRSRITLALSDLSAARQLSGIAGRHSFSAPVHIKVDTGMGRFGMEIDDVLDAVNELGEDRRIEIEGIFTHLSSTFLADSTSNEFTRSQLEQFKKLLMVLEREGRLPKMIHAGSSTALLGFPDQVTTAPFNAIRVGTLFFGHQERACDWRNHPTPVAEVSTHVRTLRDVPPGRTVSYDRTFLTDQRTRLAVLPMGYAHGYHRDLSNRGEVLIGTGRAPIRGKITLSQTIVDVTGMDRVAQGDSVILAGQDLPAVETGRRTGRGTWEILLPLLQHSERRYHDGNDPAERYTC